MVLLTAQLLCGCTFVAAYPMTSVSLGTWGVTGKSPVDHAVSGVADQDCQWMRMLEGKPMCVDTPPKPGVTDSQPVVLESKR